MQADKAGRDSPGQQAAESGIESLRREGGPFVAAVEATRMPMVVIDPGVEGNPIIFANEAFLELCGYAMDEVLGQGYLFLFGEGPDLAARVHTAMQAREDLVEEVRFRRKDGALIWVAAFVSPVVREGRVVQHFASFLDITRRVEAESDLAEANASLERRVEERTRALAAEVARRTQVEAELRDALAQRERDVRHQTFLAREVDHRAKNAMQVASSMLMLQAGQARDPAVVDALRTAMDRLDTMAEVHALLYQGDRVGSLDAGSYLRRLAERLGEALAPPGVHVQVQADTLPVDGDVAVALGLLVAEALTNSMKHAFPGGRSGNVTVALRAGGDGLVRVRVEDDGVGLPVNLREGALGLELVRAFADKLRGQVTIAPGPTGGTRVTLVFPGASLS